MLRRAFKVEGGESPIAHFAMLMKGYVNGIELYYQREHDVPKDINDLFEERYGFRFNLSKERDESKKT